MRWIKLKDRMPNKNIDGEKVLIHRVPTDSQKALATGIIDTILIKNCNKDETWWMPLPIPPIY